MCYNHTYQPKKTCDFDNCPKLRAMGCGRFCHEHREQDPGFKRKEQRRVAKQEEKKLRMLSHSNIVLDSEALELDDKVLKEKWFASIRPKLTGTCQCGCGNKSSKGDYRAADGKVVSMFRSSICHIFPKRDFHSIKYHPINWVERAFWGGCHTNMDNQSMDKWPGMADWDDIKEKFYILAPLLSDQERASKFYTHLERLIYQQ